MKSLKMNICGLLTLISLIQFGNAQSYFQTAVGGASNESGRSVIIDQNGDIVSLGLTTSFGAGNEDFYAVKMDTQGNLIWAKAYGGVGDDRGFEVISTTDNGYLMIGTEESLGPGSSNILVIKTDALGNVVWSKTYGGSSTERGFSGQQTFDGGFIIGGYTDSFGAGSFDFYLIKIDAAGNMQWTKTYGGTSDDKGKSVRQTLDGGFVFRGITSSSETMVIRTDSLGNLQWSKTYETYLGGGFDDKHNIDVTSDGGSVFSISPSNSDYDAGLMKLDQNGNVQWVNAFDIGGASQQCYAVKQTSDQGYILCGYADQLTVGGFFAVKTDASGAHEWSKIHYGGSWAYDITELPNNSYVAVGDGITNLGQGYNYYFAKMDSAGNTNCYDTTLTVSSVIPTYSETNKSLTTGSGGTENVFNPTVSTAGNLSLVCQALYDNEVTLSPEIAIFPNPNNGMFTLTMDQQFESFTIYDAKGQIVTNKRVRSDLKQEAISGLTKGVYVIHFKGKDVFKSKRVIVY
ncbi:MAG: T9SS type A sorting domain-containing protein [Flavobacteriales bacterium]|nr:T9SS type A sorting domain-containing protein [Flavobacteriales bacterium]